MAVRFFLFDALFLIIAGAANAIMDKLTHDYQSLGWQPATYWQNNGEGNSWLNKYKDRDESKGPAFPGSTTIFASFTDGWHAMKFIMVNGICLGIGFMVTAFMCVGPFSDIKHKPFLWLIGYSLTIAIACRILFGLGFLTYYII